ncbi:hypothetical protein HaLaN_02217, partial [Haematococcus lacustris]
MDVVHEGVLGPGFEAAAGLVDCS